MAEHEPQPDPSEPNPVEERGEDESLAEWWGRQDEKDGRKHDENQSRHTPKWAEDWDPNMGAL